MKVAVFTRFRLGEKISPRENPHIIDTPLLHACLEAHGAYGIKHVLTP